jgi:hypothetical protein
MKKLLILLVLFLNSVICISATYYVSPLGNDISGNGSFLLPWKTLYKATSTVTTSGNTIHVNAGIYLETQQSLLSVGVNIEGDGITSIIQSTSTAYFTSIISAQSPEGTFGNQHISNLSFDGRSLATSFAIDVKGRSNFSIYNCFFKDFEETGVIMTGQNHNAPGAPTIYAVGCSFYDNVMNNCAKNDGVYGRGCFMFGGMDGMLIYNNNITQNQRPANTNGWPIKGWCNSYIKNCKIYDNNLTTQAVLPGYANGQNEFWDFAIELFHSFGGNEIYGNTMTGSLDMNWQFKGNSAYSVWIHDNIIGFPVLQSGRQSGIILEFDSEAPLIENNIIKNVCDGIIFSMRPAGRLNNAIIRKNLIYNIGSVGGGYGHGIGNFDNGSGNWTGDTLNIYNNTIVAHPVASFTPFYGVNFGSASSINKWNFKNNIVQGFQDACLTSNVPSVISNSSFQHNNFYLNASNNLPFTTWQGTVSLPASNVISNNLSGINPLFAGIPGYTLLSNSNLIDAGTYVDLPFNGNNPDIGYAEYGGLTNIAPTADAGADQSVVLPISLVNLTGSGTDPDGTVTSYAWTQVAGPSTAIILNPLIPVAVVTSLIPGTYRFELKVTDNNGAIGKDTTEIVVTSLLPWNNPPTANAGADQTITLPLNTVNLAGSGTDTDGTITAYLWTKIAGPAGGTITDINAAATSVTGLTTGTYSFELTVTDNDGATDTDTMLVIVNPAPNLPPTSNAGPDQTITLPLNTVNLSGSGTDPDGTIVAYRWTKVAGPAATITNINAAATSVTNMVAGTYRFRLRVTDNSGAIGSDTVQIIVNPAPPANVAPTANAGADQAITLPLNTVNLAGSGTDTDGTITAYLWTKIAGPTAGVITNANAAATSVTGLTAGTYRFELTVTDNSGATGKDTMEVIVNPVVVPGNNAPTANAGADQAITLPLNTVNLAGSGTDTDGTITAYLWTKIAGPTAGVITNANAAATSVTGLTAGTYKFELTVTDNSGATGKDTMEVIVNPLVPVNVAPTANAGADQSITLPLNTVNLAGSGTDTDGTITAYLWTKIAGPTSGTITNANVAATSVTGLTAGTYRFELTVTDNSGATDTDTMQVVVNPAANVAPTANAGADQAITLPLNTVNLAGSGTDTDGTITAYLWTKIAGPTSGTITNANVAATSVNGLTAGTYRFELRVTDNSGATDTDTMQVVVNPAANVAPTANAGADQSITLPLNTVNLAGSGTDTDGTITAYLWTKIAGPTAGVITNANTAATSVTGLTAGTYRFELRVTDNSGGTDTDTMQVIVNPAANVAPTANAGADQSITLPLNTVNLAGSGTDTDGTITAYLWTKIAGPTAGTITNANVAATSVTGLTAGTYRFELTVTDNSGATDKDTMMVIVNPAVNVPPTANAGADQTITLPVSTINLAGSGTDPDGTITTYLWTKISGPTAGTITNPNVAATSVTRLVAGTYNFELRVTDNSGATDTDTMQVVVNPAPNVPPVANAGADLFITLPVNTVNLLGSGSDTDGTISTYHWTKIAGPAAGVITNANAAATSVTTLAGGVYKFMLQVTDNNGATDTDTVQVVVFVPNIAPTANAGLNQSITLPTNTASLSGTGNDVDGTIVSYIWTKISGPAAGAITNPGLPATPVTGLTAGVYQFELRVTDNNGAFGRDTVLVTVNPSNIPPVSNAGPDQSIVLPTTTITLTGSGTDVDGTIAGYTWRQISGPVDKLTSIHSPVTVLNNLIVGTYIFELTVTDNKGATDKDTVKVVSADLVIPSANTIKVYPNPVADIATLDIGRTTNTSALLILITDMQGKNVYTKQLSAGSYSIKEPLNMSTLAKGMYLVTVYFNGKEQQTLKVSKL